MAYEPQWCHAYFYLRCASFSQNAFFPQLNVLFVLLRAAQTNNIYLHLFFSLETFYWPIYGAFLITVKSWNVIFYVFYSNFSQVIFLKEQHLLREKRAHFSFSWKKGTFFSCYFYIDAYNRACHPPWQIEKCNSCAFRMVEISKIFWGQTREQTPAGGLECLLKTPQLHCRLLMAVQK